MATIEELLAGGGGAPPVAPPTEAASAAEGGAAPGLRRERNIGPWTMGTLAALAAGVALSRRPGARQLLERLWQRPLGKTDLPYVGIPGLPSELPILSRVPQSPLVSHTERVSSSTAKETHELLGKPWAKDILGQSPDVIKDVEHMAVTRFLTAVGAGARTGAAKAHAVAATPDWFREAQAHRDSVKPWADWAKAFMGMEKTPYRAGPYWHREALRDESGSLRMRGGLFGELRTSVGGAERERFYPTLRAGEHAGVQYEDPRIAWLNREVADLRLIETAKLMSRLENTVVFRDKNAAQAIAGAGAKIYELEGLPGAARFWVPHYEEWKFLMDNFKNPEYGRLGFLRGWGNALMRNPNLVNPLPHVLKNMLYKYRLAGGKVSALPADFAEFRRGRSPMVTIFKQAMPFDETGMTAQEAYSRAIHGIRREGYWAPVRLADLALDATVGKMHRASTKTIFATADPAMRFSLFKQYVTKGLTPAEAANHVWLDLIRYGTRSSVVDTWKSIPFNFFVPWRLGTMTSLWKQLQSHPIRAALFIGTIDLLREWRYRQTGRWTHLPIDYVEQPIAQILQSKGAGDAALSLIAATLATVAFGPGGGMAATSIIDLMKDLKGQGDLSRAVNMFWGLSQLFNIIPEGTKFVQAARAGDGQTAARHASNILTTAAIAEHSALNYRPRRLLAALPEVGPWLAKSQEVKAAEGRQQAMEQLGERKQQRAGQRTVPVLPGLSEWPRRKMTIEDIVQGRR